MHNFYDNIYGGDHCPNNKSNWCKTDYTKDEHRFVYDKMYLRHYITKSWEDYIYKIGVRGMFHKNHRNYESFFEMNPDMLDKKEELLKLVEPILNKYK
jgi:hypothetical protein